MPNDDMSGSEDGQLRSPVGDDHMLRYVYLNHFLLMDDCCPQKNKKKCEKITLLIMCYYTCTIYIQYVCVCENMCRSFYKCECVKVYTQMKI